MIPPCEQWAIQIDVTNACFRACSNCTRMLSHAREPFFMDLPTFESACRALASFPAESTPDRNRRRKVVGIMGGEPLLHPQFGELVTIMRRIIPNQVHRGLWTGIDWPQHRHAVAVRRLLGRVPSLSVRPGAKAGYLNCNRHVTPCFHQPVLVAIQEVIHDEAKMWEMIEACPLQRDWSGAITPKGFFFCEVAAAFDTIFDGPGGLPITPDCWCHDLADYREQIERWCPRCGMALPLKPRRDNEERDDISPGNLARLRKLGSPRVKRGEYVLFDAAYDAYGGEANWQPLRYLRGKG